MKTGDVAAMDEYGSIRIADRTKDLIKSGGEWISSVDLENVIMAHPKVKEAAVVGIAHPKWDERPLACVVLKEGESATEEEILELPQAAGRQVVAARRGGVHRRGAQDQRRQVLEEGPARRSSPSTSSPSPQLTCRGELRRQRTKGAWPVSLTIGRPAASHSPMPPAMLTASKPFWLSQAATRADRPPTRQAT